MVSVIGMYDQTRVGHKILVPPDLDITETRKFIAIQGNDGVSVLEAFYYIFGSASGNTCTADFGRFGNGIANDLCVFKM